MSEPGPYPSQAEMMSHAASDPALGGDDGPACRVLMALSGWATTTARAHRSIASIAAQLHTTDMMVSEAVALLDRQGYLMRRSMGDSTFRFVFPFVPEKGGS